MPTQFTAPTLNNIDSNNNPVHTPITENQFEAVCRIIETTTELNILKICKIVGVSNNSLDDYMKIVGFKSEQRYARARDNQLKIVAGELLEIADEPIQPDDSAQVNDKRVRIDTRKWLLSKLKPKVYGDNIQVTGDGANTMPQKLIVEFVRAKQPEQLPDPNDITDNADVT